MSIVVNGQKLVTIIYPSGHTDSKIFKILPQEDEACDVLNQISRPQSLAVLICDVQEKFRPNISFFPEIVSNSHRIMQVTNNNKTYRGVR